MVSIICMQGILMDMNASSSRIALPSREMIPLPWWWRRCSAIVAMIIASGTAAEKDNLISNF